MTITLLATSHGTDVPAAREAITALVDAVRDAAGHLDVREAFVDVQQPSIDRLVDEVDGPAVIVPLLLAPGFHVHVDIAEAADRPWIVAAGTLGADRRLAEVLVRRLLACGATPDDVIVLGASGSTDQRALDSIEEVAAMLGTLWGSPVTVGHVGGSGTPVSEVVARAAHAGRRVVVASYLMAPGFFFDRMRTCGADVVSRPLLDGQVVDPALVSLVLDRFAGAAERLDWSAAHAARSRPDLPARM